MTDTEGMTESQSSLSNISIQEIVRIIVLKPASELDILLNQTKYKHSLFFPAIYGVIVGFGKSLRQGEFADFQHYIDDCAFSIFTTVVSAFLFTFIYAWIVFFISNLLKGSASISMTFGLITYSFVPMIIGALIYLVFKLLFISLGNTVFIYIFYYGQLVFVFWSLIILVLGNAYINSFSIFRSFISSAALVVGLILFAILC